MSPFQIQILYALQFLFTPFGILAIASFVLLLTLTLLFGKLKWIVFGMMLFASTLALHTIEGTPSFMFPLEQLRTQGRATTVALMTIMTISLLILPNGWRRKYFVPGLAMFLVFQLVLSLNIAFRSDFSRGAVGMLLDLYAFFLFGVAIPHALQTWDDVISYVRGIASFGVIFAGLNLLQFFVKPSAVVAARFEGTTNNAQLVGQICAMGLLPLCYLLVRSGKARFERPLLAATAAMLVIMLTWSGSRTGVIMAVVGLALLFRARLSRLAVAGVVIALFALLAAKIIFPEKQIISEHLFSTGNTRSAVWTTLLHRFFENPFIGVMSNETGGYGESSYLAVASSLGVMGLIPFLLALAMIGWSLNHLRRLRSHFADSLLVDLVIATLVQCAAGAIFEDYLLGILTVTLLMAFAYMPVLAYLLESAESPDAVEEHVPVDPEFSSDLPAGAW
jgi:hypothetical protein